MSDSGLSVVCRACDRKVKMEQVRFDETRKAFVCDSCFASSHRISDRNPLVSAAEKSVNSLKNSLVKYLCKKCNYHFVRQKDKPVNNCPYCGSDKLEILDTTASKIVEESDKFF